MIATSTRLISKAGIVSAVLSASMLMISGCSEAPTEAPTTAIVEQILKASWDRVGLPKTILTLNAVKFGPAYSGHYLKQNISLATEAMMPIGSATD